MRRGLPLVALDGDQEQCLAPGLLTEYVIDQLEGIDLDAGAAASLEAQLDTAIAVLDDDNPNNDVAAVKTLEVFIKKVEKLRDNGEIPDADAEALITAAQAIIDLLTS